MKDISNQQFGILTAIESTGEKKWGVYLWRCRCECGNTHVAAVNSLKQGLVKSCGCLHRKSAEAKNNFHGERKTPTYQSWNSMIQRCKNKNNPGYKNYGAQGIMVCERWLDYKNFKADMGERPAGKTLDRINPFGNYEPLNCQWATTLQQGRNKKKTITTFEQAETVRKLHKQGFSPNQIKTMTGISKGSINGILYLGNISRP